MSPRRKKQQQKKEKLYTVDEMAALLKVDRRHIVEWVQYRRIPFVLLDGKSVRFRISDIVKWVETRAEPKPAYKIRETI